MEYRKLGKTSIEISEISFGCWVTGGTAWGERADDEQSIAALRYALDNGVTLLDTAEAYGGGHSETVVGRAIKGRRDKVVISTKVAPGHMSAGDIEEACEGSLKRLELERIDVYFVHWPPVETPMGRVMEAMNRLREKGKIRAIGVSNFSVAQIEEAAKYARVEVVQPCYSLFWRRPEEDGLVDYCLDNEISIICYSPIAQGLLSGKFGPESQLKEDDNRKRSALFQKGTYEKCLDAVDRLRPIAERNGKTLTQISLNWLINRRGVTSAIVGARSVEQIAENIGGSGWKLPDEDAEEMARISEPVREAVRDWPNMWNYHPKGV